MKEDVFFNFPDKMEAQMNIGDEKQRAQKTMEEHGGYHMLGIDNYPNGRVMRVVPYNQQGIYDGTFRQYYESGQLGTKKVLTKMVQGKENIFGTMKKEV